MDTIVYKFISLGVEFDLCNFDKITDSNRKKLSEKKKLMNIWSSRKLTILGKITFVKSLVS